MRSWPFPLCSILFEGLCRRPRWQGHVDLFWLLKLSDTEEGVCGGAPPLPAQVAGEGDHQRVSGSSLGGGTFWGLCRLLTRVRAFDEMLELSAQGDNAKVHQMAAGVLLLHSQAGS